MQQPIERDGFFGIGIINNAGWGQQLFDQLTQFDQPKPDRLDAQEYIGGGKFRVVYAFFQIAGGCSLVR